MIISGRTFDYRDRLREMGARWDADARNWRLDHPTNSQMLEINRMIGCITSSEPIKPITSNETIDRLVKEILSIDRTKPAQHGGGRAIYGDDASYHNCFKDTDPKAFFGFSSLSALIHYVDAIPEDMRRNSGWTNQDADWCGTRHMSGALKLAREGWPDGETNAAEIADIIAIEHMPVKRRAHGLAGGSVNVGRLLAGNPLHMRKRPVQPGRKVVTLYVETFMSSGIDPDNAIARAAIVAALSDVMERHGYSCEIVAIVTTAGPDFQIAVTLKTAGEKLNLSDTVFALGHPAFFRRMCFAVNGSASETRSSWGYMGAPADAFDSVHPCKPNEFYIRKLTIGQQRRVDETDLRSRALSILPFVIPENLE